MKNMLSPYVAAILGAVLDFPSLVQDDEVASTLRVVTGTERRVLEVAGQGDEDLLDAICGVVPEHVYHFVADRLASPRFADESKARRELLANASRMRLWGAN